MLELVLCSRKTGSQPRWEVLGSHWLSADREDYLFELFRGRSKIDDPVSLLRASCLGWRRKLELVYGAGNCFVDCFNSIADSCLLANEMASGLGAQPCLTELVRCVLGSEIALDDPSGADPFESRRARGLSWTYAGYVSHEFVEKIQLAKYHLFRLDMRDELAAYVRKAQSLQAKINWVYGPVNHAIT